jgi:hypothetical protein
MMNRSSFHVILPASLLGLGVLTISLLTPSAPAADATSFTDPFEGATLDSFWTSGAQNGTITFPATDRVHGGTQAVRFNATGSGQKELSLSHQFSKPLFGTVSTWVSSVAALLPSSRLFV